MSHSLANMFTSLGNAETPVTQMTGSHNGKGLMNSLQGGISACDITKV